MSHLPKPAGCENLQTSRRLEMEKSFYVMFRRADSRLVDGWKVDGSAPCYAFTDRNAADTHAAHLVKTMYYDVMVVEVLSTIRQDGTTHRLDV